MAVTLTEQRQAFEDGPLRVKVGSAMNVAAQGVLVEAPATPNHANRVILARQILSGQHIDSFMRAAIAANAGLANLAALLGAADSGIQTAVNNVLDAFANGQ